VTRSAPVSADATRGSHFRALARGRAATYVLVVGIAGAIVWAAATHDWRPAAGGPVLLVLLVLGISLWLADRRAAEDFWAAYAAGRGLRYVAHPAPSPMTPLLGAGERRRFERGLEGRLGPAEGLVCLETYEVRHQQRDGDGLGSDTWTAYDFTVAVVDVPASTTFLRGVYLRGKRSLLERAEDEWLPSGRRRVELESIAFGRRYDLWVVEDQDDVALRRLFVPTLIDWLAGHPFAPGFELRAGTLTVFVDRHLETAAELDFFREAAAHLATRISAELPTESGVRPPVASREATGPPT
jgi:hypothetical protein